MSTRSGLYAIYGSNFAKIIGQVVYNFYRSKGTKHLLYEFGSAKIVNVGRQIKLIELCKIVDRTSCSIFVFGPLQLLLNVH